MNFIGVDIGGTDIKAALVDKKGKFLAKAKIKTMATRAPQEILSSICELVDAVAKGRDFLAIGVGCPGTIDSQTGIVKYSNNLFWKNVDLASFISLRTKKPCFVSNDANVAALGEVHFGAGKAYSDAILVTLGTGVGTGFIVNGKLFEGFNSMGTEGGHIVIKHNGIQCTCGRKGCFEVYASATALIRETLSAMHTDKNSLMWQECEGDLNKVNGKTCFDAAKKGDKTAMRVVNDYAEALGEGAVNLANIFASQAIIFGGGVSAQGEYLNSLVQRFVDANIYGGENGARVKILTASLGNEAGVLGAVKLCLDRLRT